MSLHHIAARLRYADKDWQTFLDQKYEGGSKKVRNPNPDTREHFPEVTVNHAMKDEHFRKHIQDEYEQWKGSEAKKPKHSVGGFDTELIGNMKEHIDNVCNTYQDDREITPEGIITAINDTINFLREDYIEDSEKPFVENRINLYKAAQKIISEMNSQEKLCMMGAHKLHPILGKFLTEEENDTNELLWSQWIRSSNSAASQILHHILKSKGVKGSELGKTSVDDTSDRYKKTKDVVDKIHSAQQAVFKHLGVTHVTLYRGVRDDTLSKNPPSHGDKVKVKTREASSWTIDPSVAPSFGSRVVTCKVPIENIIASPMIHPKLGNSSRSEFEYVVMGAEDLDCEVFMDVFKS